MPSQLRGAGAGQDDTPTVGTELGIGWTSKCLMEPGLKVIKLLFYIHGSLHYHLGGS